VLSQCCCALVGTAWTAMLVELLPNIRHVHLTVYVRDFFLYLLVPFSHQTHTLAALNCVFGCPACAKIFYIK